MKIKPAVLLAVLSASTASAIRVVVRDRKNCGGNVVRNHSVFEHDYIYRTPWNSQSVFVSENLNNDTISVFDEGSCNGTSKPNPESALITITHDGCAPGVPMDTALRCYMISRTQK
ncbi:hypothetical protein BD779DRAFT_1476601 [Infundibulicybe gibba]|nr:hypothetical protein BD779DRAFT_1476601 [Infundibulicybe gibba]